MSGTGNWSSRSLNDWRHRFCRQSVMDCPDCEALILEVNFVDCIIDQLCDSDARSCAFGLFLNHLFGRVYQEPAFAVSARLRRRHKSSRISAGLVVETKPSAKSLR